MLMSAEHSAHSTWTPTTGNASFIVSCEARVVTIPCPLDTFPEQLREMWLNSLQ